MKIDPSTSHTALCLFVSRRIDRTERMKVVTRMSAPTATRALAMSAGLRFRTVRIPTVICKAISTIRMLNHHGDRAGDGAEKRAQCRAALGRRVNEQVRYERDGAEGCRQE